jgi:membrane protease YdiL (CAAX protease family)
MSIKNMPKSESLVYKLALSTILLIATASFFIGDHLYKLPTSRMIVLTAIPTASLFGLTFFFYRNARFRRYWEVTFAFFCGSFGLFLAWAPGSWPEGYFGVSTNTAQGVAILKFFELLPIALTIIVLTKIVQGNLVPIYIQKGKLKIGLGLGLLLSLITFGVYLISSWSNIDLEKAIPAIVWMIIFAISNAFFEELLIRGLFLRRYIALLGIVWSLILSTLCYALFFLGVQSATGPIPYGALIVVLPLGLLYGFIMQKSDSIWGSVSIHATIDLIYLIGVFAST